MPDFVLDSLAFVFDDLTTSLPTGTIIGNGRQLTIIGNSTQLGAPARANIRASLYSTVSKRVPRSVTVEVFTRSVDGLADARGTTIPVPHRIELPMMEDVHDASGRRRSFYLSKIELRDLGFGGKPGEMSAVTIVRPGGTSDTFFVQGLGAPLKGSAVQPAESVSPSDPVSKPARILELKPTLDARDLLTAAGVEILTVRAIPSRGVIVKDSASATERLVRSPARIVYYSGHASGGPNCLSLLDHTCWMYPSWNGGQVGLADAWSSISSGAVEISIVAGCSILGILPGSASRPDSGPGQSWRLLLRGSGGPAGLLLGYGSGYASSPLVQLGRGPLDEHAGNPIASEMGASLRLFGLEDAGRRWIDINIKYHNRAAVAIDSNGVYRSGWHPEGTRLRGIQ